jgi:hypothetical protein
MIRKNLPERGVRSVATGEPKHLRRTASLLQYSNEVAILCEYNCIGGTRRLKNTLIAGISETYVAQRKSCDREVGGDPVSSARRQLRVHISSCREKRMVNPPAGVHEARF